MLMIIEKEGWTRSVTADYEVSEQQRGCSFCSEKSRTLHMVKYAEHIIWFKDDFDTVWINK